MLECDLSCGGRGGAASRQATSGHPPPAPRSQTAVRGDGEHRGALHTCGQPGDSWGRRLSGNWRAQGQALASFPGQGQNPGCAGRAKPWTGLGLLTGPHFSLGGWAGPGGRGPPEGTATFQPSRVEPGS